MPAKRHSRRKRDGKFALAGTEQKNVRDGLRYSGPDAGKSNVHRID